MEDNKIDKDESEATFLEVFFDSLNDRDRERVEGCMDVLKPLFDRADDIDEIETNLDHERNHVAKLQSTVDRLEEEKAYWKAKASDYGDAASHADRAHLRRASAQALNLLNRIQPLGPRRDPRLVEQNVRSLESAKKILSDALVGNRRRIRIDKFKSTTEDAEPSEEANEASPQ